MTEPDNTPQNDPATEADTPVEETTPADAPVEVPAPASPTEESAPAESEVQEQTDEAAGDSNAPDLDAAPVSGVPSSSAAVSDLDQVNPTHDEDDNPEANVGDEVK